MKDFKFLQPKYLVNTYPNRGLTFVAGEGVHLIDISGERYLDMMANYGVNIFGYSPSSVNEKLIHQLSRVSVLHGSFNNDTRALAAMRLVKRCGGGLNKVHFSNSGAEAIESALKFAVLATGKKKFIACRNGYHGKTLGALSATAGRSYRGPFEPLLWTFHTIGYGDTARLERAADGDTAALLLEPIQGEGGIAIPHKGYLREAKEICASRNMLMIVDEIQTGNGRTGHFLASGQEGLAYDILCLGKGLAGGIPVGATLVSADIAEKIPRKIHTSTFGGNPLAAAGISATLDLLDEDMLRHIQETGAYFLERLKSLSSGLISQVRGRGLMIGIELKDKRDKVLQFLQRQKILAAPAAHNVIRFLPPYIIEKGHIDHVTGTMERALKDFQD